MGSFIEILLVAVSDTAHKVNNGWVIRKFDGVGNEYWLQVKSGLNNMYKAQIV